MPKGATSVPLLEPTFGMPRVGQSQCETVCRREAQHHDWALLRGMRPQQPIRIIRHHDIDGPNMQNDREAELQEAIEAVQARLRVQEFALLELLHALPRHNAVTLANGLRARVNEWSLGAGAQFTANVDESACEQLTTFLGALDEGPATQADARLDPFER
jgi:hypothetical protein